jgi:hypothetical protein
MAACIRQLEQWHGCIEVETFEEGERLRRSGGWAGVGNLCATTTRTTGRSFRRSASGNSPARSAVGAASRTEADARPDCRHADFAVTTLGLRGRELPGHLAHQRRADGLLHAPGEQPLPYPPWVDAGKASHSGGQPGRVGG